MESIRRATGEVVLTRPGKLRIRRTYDVLGVDDECWRAVGVRSPLKLSFGLHHSVQVALCICIAHLVHGSVSAANLWGMEPDSLFPIPQFPFCPNGLVLDLLFLSVWLNGGIENGRPTRSVGIPF